MDTKALRDIATNGSLLNQAVGKMITTLQRLQTLSINFGAWTAYTPTVTSGTGTFTTVSATGRYTQIGKVINGTVTVTVTTNGTAATSVIFTLPKTAHAINTMIGNGRENASTGNLLQTYVGGTATLGVVRNYDNSYPASNGSSLILSFTYEAA